MKQYQVILWCCLVVVPLCAQKEVWTWHYHAVMSEQQKRECANKKEIMFAKTDISPFTQLLFSWNALRPNQGYYSFYVQVHSKQQNAWGSWQKIADWGKDVQRSYESRSDGICRQIYVRLETVARDKADGFRIKAVAHNTDILSLKSFMVSASDFTKFADGPVGKGMFSSVLLGGVPQKSQLMLVHEENRIMCSPTSCSMLCEYITREPVDPIDFAKHAYDGGLRTYGSWPFNMAHAFELAGAKCHFYTMRLQSFKSLYDMLKRGMPVVVSVRGAILGAPKEYNNGHLLLVVGYNAQKHAIVCHDPAAQTDEETVKEYPIDSFIKAWDRSRRLAYIALPKDVDFKNSEGKIG